MMAATQAALLSLAARKLQLHAVQSALCNAAVPSTLQGMEMRDTAGLNSTKRHALKLCPACIDGLSTTLEQQQLVEGLEDVNTGLVNGARLQHSAF